MARLRVKKLLTLVSWPRERLLLLSSDPNLLLTLEYCCCWYEAIKFLIKSNTKSWTYWNKLVSMSPLLLNRLLSKLFKSSVDVFNIKSVIKTATCSAITWFKTSSEIIPRLVSKSIIRFRTIFWMLILKSSLKSLLLLLLFVLCIKLVNWNDTTTIRFSVKCANFSCRFESDFV